MFDYLLRKKEKQNKSNLHMNEIQFNDRFFITDSFIELIKICFY